MTTIAFRIYNSNALTLVRPYPYRFTFFLGIRPDLNFILFHQFLAHFIGLTKHLYLGTCDFSEMFANQQICMCTHVIQILTLFHRATRTLIREVGLKLRALL